MRLVLRYPDGTRSEALLLLQSAEVLRVVVPGFDDTCELHLVRGRWIDEEGRGISIEAILSRPEPLPAPSYNAFQRIPRAVERAMRAGQTSTHTSD